MEDINQLKKEITYWEIHNCHLQILLDQKESFLQDLLSGPNHTLIHNLLKMAQYWSDRHAHLAKFVDRALEDLPGLLKEAYTDMFPHNTPWVVFHFMSVCKVVFGRIRFDLLVAH